MCLTFTLQPQDHIYHNRDLYVHKLFARTNILWGGHALFSNADINWQLDGEIGKNGYNNDVIHSCLWV